MEQEIFDIDFIRKNAEKVSSGELESYTTSPLNSKQRLDIHNMTESFSNLCSLSLAVLGTKHKKVQIIRNGIEEKKPELTSEAIRFFSLYARVPLPNCDPQFLDYYLKGLDTYFDCLKFFSLFNRALAQMHFHELKSEATRVREEVIAYIKANEEYSKFVGMKIEIPTGIMTKSKLYHQQHKNQWFVSIDVKSANYRVLRKFCPKLADTEWKEFISKFTKTEFLIESKYFKEVIFGELGHGKIMKLPLLFVDEVRKMVESDSNLIDTMEKVFCSEDEIVYKVDENFDVMSLEKSVESLLPGHFRVEKYKLSQIGQLSYFVREFTFGKKDFKNIPKKFIMQCLKYYEHQQITEIDRKFADEDGMIATYDKDIFNNGKPF